MMPESWRRLGRRSTKVAPESTCTLPIPGRWGKTWPKEMPWPRLVIMRVPLPLGHVLVPVGPPRIEPIRISLRILPPVPIIVPPPPWQSTASILLTLPVSKIPPLAVWTPFCVAPEPRAVFLISTRSEVIAFILIHVSIPAWYCLIHVWVAEVAKFFPVRPLGPMRSRPVPIANIHGRALAREEILPAPNIEGAFSFLVFVARPYPSGPSVLVPFRCSRTGPQGHGRTLGFDAILQSHSFSRCFWVCGRNLDKCTESRAVL